MIMVYIKMVAAVIMLAQPVGHAVDRGHAGDAVAMTRSPQMSSKAAPRPAKAARHATGAHELKTAAQTRAVKQAKPKTNDAPRARIADLQPATKAAVDTRTAPAGNAVSAPANPAAGAAAADSNASNSDTRTTQQQAMAAMTAAELSTTFRAVRAEDLKTTDADRLVAIVMARPDIKSVSDLAGKNVATDGRQLNGNVRTAIAAAGATAVRLSEDQTKAIDRLIGGEVPAAVLTLVSPEAADRFPEIEGFRIFRVPLSAL
jgi:hypothetical protein